MILRITWTSCLLTIGMACMAQVVVEVKKPGTLSSLLTQEEQDTCTGLTLSGKLNSADIRILRHMAGYQDEGNRTGQLRWLDMKDCEFVTDKHPFMTLDAGKEHLCGTALPKIVKKQQQGAWGQIVSNFNVCKYAPVYTIGDEKDTPIFCETRDYLVNVGRGQFYYPPQYNALRNEGNFIFSQGLSDMEWKKLKFYRIQKFNGHKIEQRNKRYFLHAYTRKKYFFHDTFYKCPNLKVVVMPRKALLDISVKHEKCSIRYIEQGETK